MFFFFLHSDTHDSQLMLFLLFQSAVQIPNVTTARGNAGLGARRGKTEYREDVVETASVVWPRMKVITTFIVYSFISGHTF